MRDADDLIRRAFRLDLLVMIALAISCLPSQSDAANASAACDIAAGQKSLSDMGFNPGSADGIYGPKTANAVLRYQRAHNLRPSQSLDDATCSSLNLPLISLGPRPMERSQTDFVVTSSSGLLGITNGRWKIDIANFLLVKEFDGKVTANGYFLVIPYEVTDMHGNAPVGGLPVIWLSLADTAGNGINTMTEQYYSRSLHSTYFSYLVNDQIFSRGIGLIVKEPGNKESSDFPFIRLRK